MASSWLLAVNHYFLLPHARSAPVKSCPKPFVHLGVTPEEDVHGSGLETSSRGVDLRIHPSPNAQSRSAGPSGLLAARSRNLRVRPLPTRPVGSGQETLMSRGNPGGFGLRERLMIVVLQTPGL